MEARGKEEGDDSMRGFFAKGEQCIRLRKIRNGGGEHIKEREGVSSTTPYIDALDPSIYFRLERALAKLARKGPWPTK